MEAVATLLLTDITLYGCFDGIKQHLKKYSLFVNMFSSLEKLNCRLVEEAGDSMKHSAGLELDALQNLDAYCFVLPHRLVLMAHLHGK